MFVCEKCLKPEDKHSVLPISHGRCEVCGKTSDCYEVYIHIKSPYGFVSGFFGGAIQRRSKDD